MREILFRGKRIYNGEWVEGNLVFSLDADEEWRAIIIPIKNSYMFSSGNEDEALGFENWHRVDFKTVCQYTGQTDKNGNKIFEGDVVDCWSEGVNAQGTVQQRKDGLWIIYPAWQKYITWGLCPDDYGKTTVAVIGNIHDNPELLGAGE